MDTIMTDAQWWHWVLHGHEKEQNMTIPIPVRITVYETNGLMIGMWLTTPQFPTTPPRFTITNNDPRSVYSITIEQLESGRMYRTILEARIDLNQAIDNVINIYTAEQNG
jgi:hypothetical protein